MQKYLILVVSCNNQSTNLIYYETTSDIEQFCVFYYCSRYQLSHVRTFNHRVFKAPSFLFHYMKSQLVTDNIFVVIYSMKSYEGNFYPEENTSLSFA